MFSVSCLPFPQPFPQPDPPERGTGKEIACWMTDEMNCDMRSFLWSAMAIYWTLRRTMRELRDEERKTVLMKGEEPRGEQLITTDATENLLMADLLPTERRSRTRRARRTRRRGRTSRFNTLMPTKRIALLTTDWIRPQYLFVFPNYFTFLLSAIILYLASVDTTHFFITYTLQTLHLQITSGLNTSEVCVNRWELLTFSFCACSRYTNRAVQTGPDSINRELKSIKCNHIPGRWL